mmetsp:Transcript_45508/g.95540  ORF Transcript_45508/g.95540 Transcript_45508/m.95540 type:complete len:99 (-) Transcript_45508:1039-1335(-)
MSASLSNYYQIQIEQKRRIHPSTIIATRASCTNNNQQQPTTASQQQQPLPNPQQLIQPQRHANNDGGKPAPLISWYFREIRQPFATDLSSAKYRRIGA